MARIKYPRNSPASLRSEPLAGISGIGRIITKKLTGSPLIKMRIFIGETELVFRNQKGERAS
jgi:hypothetical protein